MSLQQVHKQIKEEIVNKEILVKINKNPTIFQVGFGEIMAGEEGFEPSAYGFGDRDASFNSALFHCVFLTVGLLTTLYLHANCSHKVCFVCIGIDPFFQMFPADIHPFVNRDGRKTI